MKVIKYIKETNEIEESVYVDDLKRIQRTINNEWILDIYRLGAVNVISIDGHLLKDRLFHKLTIKDIKNLWYTDTEYRYGRNPKILTELTNKAVDYFGDNKLKLQTYLELIQRSPKFDEFESFDRLYFKLLKDQTPISILDYIKSMKPDNDIMTT